MIKSPGQGPKYQDIPESDVSAVVQEFESIGESVERFNAFLSGVA